MVKIAHENLRCGIPGLKAASLDFWLTLLLEFKITSLKLLKHKYDRDKKNIELGSFLYLCIHKTFLQ